MITSCKSMGRALYYPVLSSRRIVVLAYLYQCHVYCASIFGSVLCTRAIRKAIYGTWSRSPVLPMVFAPLFAPTAVASFFFLTFHSPNGIFRLSMPIVDGTAGISMYTCRFMCAVSPDSRDKKVVVGRNITGSETLPRCAKSAVRVTLGRSFV